VLLDLVVVCAFQDRFAGELGAIVRNDAGWFSIDPDQCLQFPGHPSPRDACVSHQAQIFAAAIVIHSQNAELPTGPEGGKRCAVHT